MAKKTKSLQLLYGVSNTGEIKQTVETGTTQILAAIDKAVFDKELLKALLARTLEDLTDETIVDVGDYALYNMASLKNVSLPNCVRLGEGALGINLYDAEENAIANLETVHLPNVVELGKQAFLGQRKMTLTPGSLQKCTEFPALAFDCCSALTDAVFPNVKTLGNNVFNNSGIKIAEFAAATTIDQNVFANCYDLQTVVLPLVTEVGSGCFLNDSALNSVHMPLLTTTGGNMFMNCKSLTNLNLPMLVSCYTQDFYNCTALASVELPVLATVGSNAFRNCTALEEIALPALVSLNKNAFQSCTGLKKIWIPASCTTITAGSYSASPFYKCSSDLKIFCEASAKQSGWGTYWNYYASGKECTVHWGATYEDYEAY